MECKMGGNSGLIPIVIVIVIVIMCHFFTNCFEVLSDIRLIFRTFTILSTPFVLLQKGRGNKVTK